MLTKEERAAIAERLRGTYYITNSTLFKALTGEEELIENDQVKELCVIGRVIFDLCDTSNMIELPLDKDGEVIHIGDTLYDDKGTKIKVCGFLLREINGKILLDINANNGFVVMSANKLTHKRPVTIASLVGEIRRTLSQNTIMNKETTAKLWEITDQIEMLGDSDAN